MRQFKDKSCYTHLHVVSDRLGHKDPMVTATIYAHVSDEQAETASNTFANRTRNAIQLQGVRHVLDKTK